jgi:hypothetical protein
MKRTKKFMKSRRLLRAARIQRMWREMWGVYSDLPFRDATIENLGCLVPCREAQVQELRRLYPVPFDEGAEAAKVKGFIDFSP